MSGVYFKSLIKRNGMLLIIFIAVLTMYMSVMIAMYVPEDTATLDAIAKMLPEKMMKAMGFSSIISNLTSYLASWLYGLLMLGFPLVYCVILGNKLVAKLVDNSSFAYLLSTPNSRVKLILTSGIYALFSVAVLFGVLFAIGAGICRVVFPDLLDIGAFFKLNVTTMLVNMTVMMVSFFFSCLFNETKRSLGFGAGIPMASLLLNMLGSVSTESAWLKNISLHGLYDPVKLVQGGSVIWIDIIYVLLIALLFSASVVIFNRKRLPL